MSNDIFTEEIQQLRARQAAEAKAKAQRIEEIKAKYQGIAEEKAAAEEMKEETKKLAIQKQMEAAAEQAEQELKASALAMWKKLGGGDDTDFQTAWPSLKASLLSVKMQVESQRQAAQISQFYRNAF